MSSVLSYNDFLKTANHSPSLKNGLVIDTNVLVSATYDSDPFYDLTNDFLDFVIENDVPLFCNVTVRTEFLEIHRRIIFSEILFDFADTANLPMTLASQLGKWKKNNQTRKDSGKTPLRLSESDIKKVKLEMMKISSGDSDVWSILCQKKIGNKLGDLWQQTVDGFGLNFLSVRTEDIPEHLNKAPDWGDVIRLIEQYGLSSSDAMILNMFFVSKFNALITSDQEVAVTFKKIQAKEKICFVPHKFIGLN